MTPELRAALLAQTEARQGLNALPEDASDEDRAAAVAKLGEADQALAELLAKEPEDTTTPHELRDRISLGRYLHAAAEERALDGAERELQQELKLSERAIPLEALLPTPEERADVVSPQNAAGNAALPSGTININTGPMLNRLFTATDTAFLGISMPMVPAGERRYPIMTGGTTAKMVARGAQPDAGGATFDVVDINPHRLTGRYILDLEGVAEMGGLLESTLRSDLRTEMGYQLDLQILNGTGADNQVSGIVKELALSLPPGSEFDGNNVKAVIAWATAREMAFGSLDGKLARMESDLRFLIGQATYNILRAAYRNANAGDAADAIDAMRSLGSSVRSSYQLAAPAVATIPPKSANSTKKVQDAIMSSEPGAAVAPVWQGITMIRDPYTNAGKAQVVLTAHMLFGFAFRRKDGWKKYAVRTEA